MRQLDHSFPDNSLLYFQIGDPELLPRRCWGIVSVRHHEVSGFIIIFAQDERPIVRDSRESFANLARWLEDARALASPHLVVVLVGNKSDREEDREVEWEEASRWAAEHSMCPCDGGGCFWLTYGRCPLPRDVLADGR